MPHSPKNSAYARPFTALLLIATAIAACSPEASEPSAPADDANHENDGASLSLSTFTPEVNIYVDYSATVAGKQSRFALHLTDAHTGLPLQATSVRLDFMQNGEVVQRMEQSEAAQAGLYLVQAFLPGGRYRLQLESDGLAAGGVLLGEIEVYADDAAANDALHNFEHALPSEAVMFSVEQQWKVGLRSTELQRANLAERVEVAASVVVPPHAQAMVRAPFDGAWSMPDGEAFPRLGQQVLRGQLLGEIQVSLDPADRAAVEANALSRHEHEKEIQLREFDLRVREVEAAQAEAMAASRLEFAASELERLGNLNESGLAKQSEILRAEAEQRSATLAYQAAQKLLASLAEVHAELEALHGEDWQSPALARAAQLHAPIDGVVVELNYSLGEWVPAAEVALRIVDPRARWIELQIPESLLHQGDELASVKIALPGTNKYFDLQNDWGGEQVFRSAQVNPLTRCLSVYASCPGAPDLAEGMRLTAALATRESEQAWAIPQSAVVDEAGVPIVFVLVTGELFEKRSVRLGVRDGDFVEVLDGLSEGDRVVSSAAYLLRLAAASSDNFGHGHVH